MDSLGGTREAPARHQGGTREAGKDHLDSLGGTREAERTKWRRQGGTREAGKWEAPGRQKGLIEQPGRHQGTPGRQERTTWTACEAPGRHQGGWTAWEAPGRQERTHWTAREAGKDHLDCHERAQAWPASPRMGFRVIIFIRDKARRL